MKYKYVKCVSCGKIDHPLPYSQKTQKRNVGTATIMKCEDCCDETGYAKKCRACCPSGHQTR